MSNNWYWQFLQQNISNICVTHCKSAANFLIKMSDQCYWFANFLQKKCFCRVIRLILASFAKNILATFVSHCALVRQIFLEKCLINAFDLLIFYKKKILSCHSIDSGKFCKKNISNICVTLCKSAANFPIKMSDQCFWFANFFTKKFFCRVIRLILAIFATKY